MDQVVEKKLSMAELEAGLAEILNAPNDNGIISMIAVRPNQTERIVLEVAEITAKEGVVGDNWKSRGSKSMPDKSSNPAAQITLMNSRVIQNITRHKSRWQWAGDQLYADLNLSKENLEPGQQLLVGTAVLEVSALPHAGCAKFVARFGKDAHKFVNNPYGSKNRFRGVNLKVVQDGTVHVGDVVRKL